MTDTPNANPTTPSQPPPQRRPEGSIRETLESILIAFVLAFVFRAFVVEAFVIPTGSMAPTLLGQHAHLTCPQCGYRYTIGPTETLLQTPICPMCDYAIPVSNKTLSQIARGPDAGDRILVLKYPYQFSEPTRWDVVVFKNPKKPEENYIKRLVGLPGEELRLVAGNVYTRPLAGDKGMGPWQIQRKPAFVQRAVWQPIYHSTFYPLDAQIRPWKTPWQPAGPTADRWTLSDNGQEYRFNSPDAQPGVLSFRFSRRTASQYYAYNMLGRGPGEEFVDEMRIAATVIPQGPGARATFTTTGRSMAFRAVIEPDGKISLHRSVMGETGPGAWSEPLVQGRTRPLPADRASRVEFWHADQALSLWIDGALAAYWTYDMDMDQPANVQPTRQPPAAAIEVQGPTVAMRDIELDRDLYYTQSFGRPIFGAATNPAVIPPDRFFVMGDNSPQSEDSRLWGFVDEWVAFYTDVETGLVPRDLMIGRAFFVYFPAPLPLSPDGPAVIPNFGNMRFIH
jgi:signal peptidase I